MSTNRYVDWRERRLDVCARYVPLAAARQIAATGDTADEIVAWIYPFAFRSPSDEEVRKWL